jgi:hypothetical protein
MDVATSAHIDQLPLTMGQYLSDGMMRFMPEQLRLETKGGIVSKLRNRTFTI